MGLKAWKYNAKRGKFNHAIIIIWPLKRSAFNTVVCDSPFSSVCVFFSSQINERTKHSINNNTQKKSTINIHNQNTTDAFKLCSWTWSHTFGFHFNQSFSICAVLFTVFEFNFVRCLIIWIINQGSSQVNANLCSFWRFPLSQYLLEKTDYMKTKKKANYIMNSWESDDSVFAELTQRSEFSSNNFSNHHSNE